MNLHKDFTFFENASVKCSKRQKTIQKINIFLIHANITKAKLDDVSLQI